MATILAVDDDITTLNIYEMALGEEGHTVLTANTSSKARLHLTKPKLARIDAIILDGFLGERDRERDTEQLAIDIRAAGFTGPMFAATDSDLMRGLLLKAGCSHVLKKRLGRDGRQLINETLTGDDQTQN